MHVVSNSPLLSSLNPLLPTALTLRVFQPQNCNPESCVVEESPTSLHCIETHRLFLSFPFECFRDPRQKFGVLELHLQLTLSGSFVEFWSLSQGLVVLPLVWRNSPELVSKHSTWLRGHPAPCLTRNRGGRTSRDRRQHAGTPWSCSPEPEGG